MLGQQTATKLNYRWRDRGGAQGRQQGRAARTASAGTAVGALVGIAGYAHCCWAGKVRCEGGKIGKLPPSKAGCIERILAALVARQLVDIRNFVHSF